MTFRDVMIFLMGMFTTGLIIMLTPIRGGVNDEVDNTSNRHKDPNDFTGEGDCSKWEHDTYCEHCLASVGHSEEMTDICLSCGTPSASMHYSKRAVRSLYIEGKKFTQRRYNGHYDAEKSCYYAEGTDYTLAPSEEQERVDEAQWKERIQKRAEEEHKERVLLNRK